MVVITESSLVVPSKDTPKHTIWLSNLDLILGHWYTTLVYLFRHNGEPDFFSIEPLKLALSKALVHYYPFAGRVVYGENGRPEVNCNGEGIRFVVARSTNTIDEFVPSLEMGKKLVSIDDSAEPPFLIALFQVTFFKCGGVSLGITGHHGVADGRCFFNFYKIWSQIARGILPETITLSLDRTSLRARQSSPKILSDLPEYQLAPITKSNTNDTDTEIFTISKQQLLSLKRLVSNVSTNAPTTFKAIVAHVWRCCCKAWGAQSDEETSVLTQVDIIKRMVPRLPENFFGNALVRSSVKANVGDILTNSIQFAADKINEAIVRVDDEFVRAVIDSTEVNAVKCWRNYKFSTLGMKNSLYIANWLHMPLFETNFSWGSPMAVSRSHVHSQFGTFMQVMQNPNGDGGVRVVMAMERGSMARFKTMFSDELE